MKKEHIMDAMDHIDAELVAQADHPAARGGRRWVRAAMIAACLCLALVGTVAAAQYLGVRIVDGAGGEDDADVWLEGGIVYYPVDSLPEQVAELDDPFYAGRAFNSWDEMEEFIGVDLMDNPVLDAHPATRFSHIWNAGDIHVAGSFLAIGSGGLSDIHMIGCYEIGEANITVEGFLFTDRMTEKVEDWDERFLGYAFADDAQMSRESYTANNGLEIQIMKIDRTAGKDKYKAVFSLNGVPFIVTVQSGTGLNENRDVLFQVLDGFVLS